MNITFKSASNVRRIGSPFLYKSYPHGTNVTFDESQSGWTFQGKNCKTIDEWLDCAKKCCVTFGLDDAVCEILPSTNPKNPQPIIHLAFKQEVDLLRFCAIAFGNNKGTFNRTINAHSKELSELREHRIQNFIEKHEIDARIYRTTHNAFIVYSHYYHDDIAIAIHLAKGDFDLPLTPRKKFDNTALPKTLLEDMRLE